MDKEQVILKVKEILDTKTRLTKISEDEYEGEITINSYDDMYLEPSSVKKYLEKGRLALEQDIIEWTCDSDIYEYDWLLGTIRDYLEEDIMEEYYDIILDYVYENIHYSFPKEFVWGTEVPVNILITAYDDWNYEFTQNEFYDGELLDGGVKWLVQQQGYNVKDFENEVNNDKPFSNVFFKSLYQEVIDTTTSLNALTVSIKMTLEEIFNIKEALENKTLKEIRIDKDCNIGLVDFWQGAGGTLNIALEKDLVIPIENIDRIDSDYNFCYGIGDIYGMRLSEYWNEVGYEVSMA